MLYERIVAERIGRGKKLRKGGGNADRDCVDRNGNDAASADLSELIKANDGNDEVAIYLSSTKQIKKLGRAFAIKADKVMMESLEKRFGKENVQIR